MTPNAQYYIEHLNLEKHPEGGYYKEIFRSDELIEGNKIHKRYSGKRAVCTSIYYLLQNDDFSAFHRLQSDEIWHFYTGSALKIYHIDKQGILKTYLLGNDIHKNEQFQCVIPHGTWFAARLLRPNTFALIGCTVAPGFCFSDFELAKRNELISQYPVYEDIIILNTRK